MELILKIIIKSGKYRIGKKEYIQDSNKSIFEGEYLNGKRNGKGIEYDTNSEIKFEGQYLNRLKNGKRKEYYYKNFYYQKKEIQFKVKYLNGLKNGKGKEYKIYKFRDYYYDANNDYYEHKVYLSELEFKGKYLNGKRNGKGKEYYKNEEM